MRQAVCKMIAWLAMMSWYRFPSWRGNRMAQSRRRSPGWT